MKRSCTILIAALFVVLCNNAAAQKFDSLIWSDEFNKDGLPDPAKWSYEEGQLRNGEAQFYTKRKENARIKNGVLIIEARKENYDTAKFTSASLNTQKTKLFTYGRIEFRAKIPMGRGTWPALWMLGASITEIDWPACGEINIMEHVGYDSMMIHANIHTEAYNHSINTGKGSSILMDKPWKDFHIYAVDWYEDHLDFSVDGKIYFSYKKEPNATNATWPFDKPHFIMMNFAVGGGWGGNKGIYEKPFPHQFLIDYVRVYQ
jgi:beta-glucanase (GH16 family)